MIPKNKALAVIFLVLTVFIAGCASTGRTAVQLDEPSYELVNENIINDLIIVDAGDIKHYEFSVPSSTNYASVTGTFAATGGNKNDIRVLIFDEDNYADWRTGRSYTQFFDSGIISTGNISASLTSGTFYLVYSNRFSTFARKGVRTSVNFTYQKPV